MIVVNIHEAKAKLSEYLDAVGRGECVMICKRNQPVAELRAVTSVRTEPRPIGEAKFNFELPVSFFEPLPDEIVDAFYGDLPKGQGTGKVAARPDDRAKVPAKAPGRVRRKTRR